VLPLLGLTGYPTTMGIDPVTRGIVAWDGVLNSVDQVVVHTWARSAITARRASSAVLTTDAAMDLP
jgi:hypothetical protein